MLPLVLVLNLAAADDVAARIAKGEVVVTTRKVAGSEIEEASGKAIIDAPPEQVWAIVSKCENYKDTMPGIIASKLVHQGPPAPEDGPFAVELHNCRVTADLPFPFEDLTSVSRAVHSVEPGKEWRRQWKLIEGNYHKLTGAWILKPYGADGKRTLAEYRIHAEPKVALPPWLLTSIQNGKLPEVMGRVRTLVKAQ